MAKVDIDILKKLLERNEVDVRKRNLVLQDIKRVLEQEAMEKGMMPSAPKKQLIFLASDPHGPLKNLELTGWVLEIPEGDDPALALDKIAAAAYEHNASPKGRKFPVETIGAACESVSPKILKEQKVSVKTKLPVVICRTDNKLPKAPGLPS